MKISIIIPFRNDFLALKESLLSLSRQSFLDWELHAVDLGSVDGSRALLASYGPARRFHVLPAQEREMFSGINWALKQCSGEYVWILEAGDRFLDREFVASTARAVSGKSLALLSYQKSSTSETIFEFDFASKEKLLNGEYPLCSLVFRKSWLQEVGGFDESYLLSAHKKLLSTCAKSLESNEIVTVKSYGLMRDSGNWSYLHQYGPLRNKESLRF